MCRACRITVMSTKSREAICSVFNEQTSAGDADQRFAGDKLISCLKDSDRRSLERRTNFSSARTSP